MVFIDWVQKWEYGISISLSAPVFSLWNFVFSDVIIKFYKQIADCSTLFSRDAVGT